MVGGEFFVAYDPAFAQVLGRNAFRVSDQAEQLPYAADTSTDTDCPVIGILRVATTILSLDAALADGWLAEQTAKASADNADNQRQQAKSD